MRPDLLILRPEPGASRTAERARAMGLEAVAAPLFTIEPLAWDSPDATPFDAILFTSANAVRNAGEGLALFTHLPCYAVGEETAALASQCGFTSVAAGVSDGAALLEQAAGDGRVRLFHPCGRDRIALSRDGIAIEPRIVYVSHAREALPSKARRAVEGGALVLLHSPRAALCFGALFDGAGYGRGDIRIAAISPAVAEAAGPGWKFAAAARTPRDDALLELALRLCHTSPAHYEGDE